MMLVIYILIIYHIHSLLYCYVPASHSPRCICHPSNSFDGKYVDGRRSFPRALSRCCYKQRLLESQSPAVKLCGRASICDPFYDYSEFLYITRGLLKFLYILNRVIIYVCTSVSVCRLSRTFDIYRSADVT